MQAPSSCQVPSRRPSTAAVTRGAEYAFARGQMGPAESGFQKALEIAQAFPPGDLRLEVSLENLGRFYEHQSQFAKAQPLYQLLLAAQEYRVGPDDPALLNTLFIVARVSQPLGDLPTVESCLTRFDAIATASDRADPRRRCCRPIYRFLSARRTSLNRGAKLPLSATDRTHGN